MIRTEDLREHHFGLIDLQSRQIGEWDPENAARLASVSSGECVFCGDDALLVAGVVPIHDGCARAWAMVAEGVSARQYVELSGVVIRFLDKIQRDPLFRRVETVCQSSRPEFGRWARHLGFQFEGVMRCYDKMGRDFDLYARITDVC